MKIVSRGELIMKRMSYWIEDLVKRWSRSGKKKRQKDIIILLALFTLS
ncbi:MAG: hypothetical protein GX175_06540 [Halanaerobiaceae bacterium]|nr:hypothetical protein [Halanaerobiaceae bacterium]